MRAKQVAIWLVGALACAAAFAAQTTVAHASLVTYKVTFTGSGSFKSTDLDAIEGAGSCANATDRVTEKSSFSWRTNYTLTISRRGEDIVTETGSNVDQAGTKWLQSSEVTPPDCFGGTQDCTGVLFPASPRHPASPNDVREPKMVVSAQDEQMFIDSVVDWVVGPQVGGPRACQSYARYHTAIQPFSLAAHIMPRYKHLTVQNAMSAYVPLQRSELNRGREFSVKVKQPKSDQPPENCKPLTIDAISCTEQLTWGGEVTFRPA